MRHHTTTMTRLAVLPALLGLAIGCDDKKDGTTDLYVVTVNPGDLNTNVNPNIAVIVRCSTPVDPASYSGTAQQILVVDQNNSSVPVTIRPTPAEPASEFITITPATPLAANTTYGVAVRELVRSTQGEAITTPYAMTFSTGASISTIPGWPPFLNPNPAPPNTGPPGTFTLTGQLVTPRSRHQEVTLQTGDVAIFGGVGPNRASLPSGIVQRTAEVYHRNTGTWTVSSSNNYQGAAYPRYGHTATLLQSGKILIAGGGDERTIWDTAEIYDPQADSFAPTSTRMQISRQYHTSTLLGNGNVLLCAGFSMSSVLTNFTGGSANAAIIDWQLEVFDVPSGTFLLSTQQLAREKCYHTASMLSDGDVMFAGGFVIPFGANFWCPTTALCDRYRPDLTTGAGHTGTMSPTGNLQTARMNHTATIYTSGQAQGLVIIMGGYQTAPFATLLGSAEVYDSNVPIQNGFKGDFALVAANMTQARRAHTTSLINSGSMAGQMVMIGGARTAPTTQSIIPPAPPHFWPSTESHNCGFCSATKTAETFNPFGYGYSLQSPYRGIDITGKFDWTRDATGAQTLMVGIPPNPAGHEGRYYHTASTLPTGHILLAGGWNCPFCSPFAPPTFSGPETALGTCELYNP